MQIRAHARSLLQKMRKVIPKDMTQMDFIRSKPLEWFESAESGCRFDLDYSSPDEENKEEDKKTTPAGAAPAKTGEDAEKPNEAAATAGNTNNATTTQGKLRLRRRRGAPEGARRRRNRRSLRTQMQLRSKQEAESKENKKTRTRQTKKQEAKRRRRSKPQESDESESSEKSESSESEEKSSEKSEESSEPKETQKRSRKEQPKRRSRKKVCAENEKKDTEDGKNRLQDAIRMIPHDQPLPNHQAPSPSQSNIQQVAAVAPANPAPSPSPQPSAPAPRVESVAPSSELYKVPPPPATLLPSNTVGESLNKLLNDLSGFGHRLEEDYTQRVAYLGNNRELGEYWRGLQECSVSLLHVVNDIALMHQHNEMANKFISGPMPILSQYAYPHPPPMRYPAVVPKEGQSTEH